MFGVDVSQYNDKMTQDHYDKLREGGIEFAVVRATIGLAEDVLFLQNVDMAVTAGMIVGAYHFLKPSDGIAQAEAFASQCSATPDLNFWVLDVEDDGIRPVDVANFVAALGPAELGLYSRQNLLEKYEQVLPHFAYQWLARYDDEFVNVWLSELDNFSYNDSPSMMWQFTESMKYTVAGKRFNIDGNHFDGSNIDFLRYVGAIN